MDTKDFVTIGISVCALAVAGASFVFTARTAAFSRQKTNVEIRALLLQTIAQVIGRVSVVRARVQGYLVLPHTNLSPSKRANLEEMVSKALPTVLATLEDQRKAALAAPTSSALATYDSMIHNVNHASEMLAALEVLTADIFEIGRPKP